MASFQILVIGSINVDFTMRTSRFPGPGETITATSCTKELGGKGANQAIACARASRPGPEGPSSIDVANIHMIGAVGSDSLEYLESLASNGVNTDKIKAHEGKVTGMAVVVVSEATGENNIIITPGANALVGPEILRDIAPPVPDLIILQLEIPLETVLDVIYTARRQGIDVLLNPAPAPAPAQLLQIQDASKALAHLVMNETEASILSGEAIGGEGQQEEEPLKRLFKKFKGLGVRNTIVTLGERGVCYSTIGSDYVRVDAVKVKEVVDTTAAGDTFVGYYAVEVVKGKRNNAAESLVIDIAVTRANRAASRTIEKAGASPSIPWMNEVDQVKEMD
ncbi:hypothetical protein MMC30_000617 [Trapelia coarctata]|nr:hypothetical protein [Trapelia coarctata]